MKKILFISSPGGHWVQLLKIAEGTASSDHEVAISSTYKEFYSGFKYYNINDFNRNNLIYGIIKILPKLYFILKDFSPDLVVTTGAAPGLIASVFFRVFKVKVIWVDSLANSEEISMSGKIASITCNTVLTQWKNLETKNIKYKGRVL
jgi:UDP-N-acetylglucosamine:LPS N-acetylglucosamine transferase